MTKWNQTISEISFHPYTELPIGDFDVSDFPDEMVKLMTEAGATSVDLTHSHVPVDV